MIEQRIAGFHRILIITKMRQSLRDKIIQGRKRVFTRHRPAKIVRQTDMVGKHALDQCHHLLCDGIRGKAFALGQKEG